MLSLLFAQVDPFLWSNLLSEYGPLIGVVLFFIWRDWKREDKLSERIRSLEEYQRETLAELVSQSTVALTHNADCMKWVGSVMSKICDRCPELSDCSKPPQTA
jgi:hypothetical protein